MQYASLAWGMDVSALTERWFQWLCFL